MSLAILVTSGCQSGEEYGIGAYCDEYAACRAPLACVHNRCALRDHSGGMAGMMAGTQLANAGASTQTSLLGGAPSSGGSAHAGTAGTAEAGRSLADGKVTGAAGQLADSGGTAGAAGQLADSGGTAGATNLGLELQGGMEIGGMDRGGAGQGNLDEGGTNPGVAGHAGSPWSFAGQAGSGAAAGASRVPLGLGERCMAGGECNSTHCVDGVCCDAPCTEQCRACNQEQQPGHCSALASGTPVGSRTPCTAPNTTCGGSCTGKDTCTYPGSEISCTGPSICVGDAKSLSANHCDGKGSCSVEEEVACGSGESCSINADGRCAKPYFTQVDVSLRNGCAVRSDGALYCWGDNGMKQLAVSNTDPQLKPTLFPTNGKVRSVAAGYWSVCYVLWDGQVDCWGYDAFNVLGCNTPTLEQQHCTPLTAGSGAVEVSSTNAHTCVRFANGTLQCWGYNISGQAGTNQSVALEPVPADVVGVSTAVSLSVGLWHAGVVLANGTLKSWGNNEAGQLGIGRSGDSAMPTYVSGLPSPVAQLSATGVDHTCVLLQNQSVWCWGDNSSDEIGIGYGPLSYSPVGVRIPNSGVRAVAVGDRFTCLLEGESTVSCWGKNDRGVFGDGSFDPSSFPVTAQLPKDPPIHLRTIVAKYASVCALSHEGRIWCWGDNGSGQLGNGTTLTTGYPTEVVLP